LTLAFFAMAAQAGYPDHAIRLIVGFPPGGGGDLYGRAIAAEMGKLLNTSIIVDNKSGAGGNIAAEAAARSAPDGYTLLLAMSSNIALAPVVMGSKLSYRVPEDFVAIGGVAQAPHGLFVAGKSKYHTAREALDAAKPGKLSYGSSGPGSVGFVTMEMIKERAGLNILAVPYRGSGPAIIDMLAGLTDMFFATAPPVMGQVTSGALRLLAITGDEPNPALPGIPTFKQLGIDVTVAQWYGLMAPAGTPPEIVAQLSAALNKALDSPSVKSRINRDGATVMKQSPDQFREFVLKDIKKYRNGIPRTVMVEMAK
jgi:tripartite-type tricarboxylate transporter receptor subunit TctC